MPLVMNMNNHLVHKLVDVSEMGPEVKRMYSAAVRASRMSRPADSGYEFGCAASVKGSDRIITGFSIENSQRNDSFHAEESMGVSLRRYMASRPDVPKKPLEAILVTSNLGRLVAPCGPCRDWLLSYTADFDMPVFMADYGGRLVKTTLHRLLPTASDLLRREAAVRLPVLKRRARYALDQGRCHDVGRLIMGNDIIRYARLISEENKVFDGVTSPRSDYQGFAAIEAAFNNLLCQKPGSSGRIMSAYLVVPSRSRRIDLPYGCERQVLFEIARAQKSNIDVIVIDTDGRAVKTDAISLLPHGFAADPISCYIRTVLFGRQAADQCRVEHNGPLTPERFRS